MNNLIRENNAFRNSPSKINSKKVQKKKLNFKTMRKNTISSLNDVEFFLNNINKISSCVKIFKLFK